MNFYIYCTDGNFIKSGYDKKIKESGLKLKPLDPNDENGPIYGCEFCIDLTSMKDFVKLKEALNCELILTDNHAIEIYNDFRE
jgi:hypothetical protein